MDDKKNKKGKRLSPRFKNFLIPIKSSGPRPKRPRPKQKPIIVNITGNVSVIKNSSGPRPKRHRSNSDN